MCDALKLIKSAKIIFQDEANVVSITDKVNIVGDIHGQ